MVTMARKIRQSLAFYQNPWASGSLQRLAPVICGRNTVQCVFDCQFLIEKDEKKVTSDFRPIEKNMQV